MAGTQKKEKPEGYVFGRPTNYLPEYCQAIIEYFDRPATATRKKTITTSKGTEIVEEIECATSLPTLEGFAGLLKTTTDVIVNWTKKHKDFYSAYMRAKAHQKRILIENGTKGLYNAQFTIFVAKNCTDMKDKIEMDDLPALTINLIQFGEGSKAVDKGVSK